VLVVLLVCVHFCWKLRIGILRFAKMLPQVCFSNEPVLF